MFMSLELNSTIIKREELNQGLVILRVKPDFDLKEFKPGQYCVLGLPVESPRVIYAEDEHKKSPEGKMIRRAYSIASSSKQHKFLEFYISMVSSGALTPRLFNLKKGDKVFMGSKITGMFTLDDTDPNKDVVFVATGTGITPYISMLRSAYKFEKRRTIVIHGARTSWNLGYRNALEGVSHRFNNFFYLPIIDNYKKDKEWKGHTGFVNKFFDDGELVKLLGYTLNPKKVSFFLCGNPLMVNGLIKILSEYGYKKHTRKEPGDIFTEEW